MTKRKIAYVLLIGFILIDGFGFFYANVPRVTIPALMNVPIGYWVNIAPPVSVEVQIWLTASGALSVNNPVTVRAIVTDANVTDLLRYYNAISFTDAYQTDGSQNAKIPLKANPSTTGEYDADGTIIWLIEGPTWVIFLPNTEKNIVANRADVTKGDAVAQIASIGDTLSIQNSVTEQRLTWVLVGFSVLMLQPILEALFLKENPKKTEQAKPQGLWHPHKLWRKSRSK